LATGLPAQDNKALHKVAERLNIHPAVLKFFKVKSPERTWEELGYQLRSILDTRPSGLSLEEQVDYLLKRLQAPLTWKQEFIRALSRDPA
jgi:hypothetical protein